MGLGGDRRRAVKLASPASAKREKAAFARRRPDQGLEAGRASLGGRAKETRPKRAEAQLWERRAAS
jgi:hypothetical protein